MRLPPPMLIGSSPAWRSCIARVERLAPLPIHILISGEAGTGKEGIARMLHALSRRPGDLVPVNCATLHPDLASAELFGYERGAFTGATASCGGLLYAAHDGTLFLDEVGELPLVVQAQLLRALQDGTFRRVGAVEEERMHLRVAAATHRPLWELADAGACRRDLLERLAQYELQVPPLRARGDDVCELAAHIIVVPPSFLRQSITFLSFSPAAQEI